MMAGARALTTSGTLPRPAASVRSGTVHRTIVPAHHRAIRSGATADYRVRSAAGVEPLQPYLLETEPGAPAGLRRDPGHRTGRLGPSLPRSASAARRRPAPDRPIQEPERPLRRVPRDRPREGPRRHAVQPCRHPAEFGVGCEVCHGSGDADVGREEALSTTREAPAPAGCGFCRSRRAAASAGPSRRPRRRCATCGSRHTAHTDAWPLPGTPFNDACDLALLHPGPDHDDGQILDGVHVSGSFLQSKMSAAGVGCRDGHDAHTAEIVATGNAVCTHATRPVAPPASRH